MTPTNPRPEAVVPEVHPTLLAACPSLLPDFVTGGTVADTVPVEYGSPIRLIVNHGESSSILDGEVIEGYEDEIVAMVWGLAECDARLKGLWKAAFAWEQMGGRHGWVLVALQRAPECEPEAAGGKGHAGALATGLQTLVMPDLPRTVNPPSAKRRFSDKQRVAHATKTREAMHATLDRGEKPEGPKADWIRESAGHVLELLGEIAEQYNAEHEADAAITGDMLDILATVREHLAND